MISSKEARFHTVYHKDLKKFEQIIEEEIIKSAEEGKDACSVGCCIGLRNLEDDVIEKVKDDLIFNGFDVHKTVPRDAYELVFLNIKW